MSIKRHSQTGSSLSDLIDGNTLSSIPSFGRDADKAGTAEHHDLYATVCALREITVRYEPPPALFLFDNYPLIASARVTQQKKYCVRCRRRYFPVRTGHGREKEEEGEVEKSSSLSRYNRGQKNKKTRKPMKHL